MNIFDIPSFLKGKSNQELKDIAENCLSPMETLRRKILPLRKEIADLERDFVYYSELKWEAEMRSTPVKKLPYAGKKKSSKKKPPSKREKVSKSEKAKNELASLQLEAARKQALLDKLLKVKGLA